MAPNTLPPDLFEYVTKQVADGRFATTDAVVAEAVRRMKASQDYNDWVRARIAEADLSLLQGDVLELDDKEWDELFDRIERGEEIAQQRVTQ
jgi:Arc/MetJ-type ribon-helix-helix transcriptional regulator